ncbi:hypothetical protein L0F40_13335, partial [Klebsiella pneumoniae]|nr:hypothetical protein [Klebsiella pneumoniae]
HPGQPVSGGPNDTSVGEISVKTGNNARNGGKNSLNRLIRLFAGKKSAQIREILISESAWEEMTCLFAPSLNIVLVLAIRTMRFRKSSIIKYIFKDALTSIFSPFCRHNCM